MDTKAIVGIYLNAKQELFTGFKGLLFVKMDGYPEDAGIVRFLVPFLAYYKEVYGSVNYVVPNLIYLIMKESWEKTEGTFFERHRLGIEKSKVFIKSEILRYALDKCRGINEYEDVEYIYRVNMREEIVQIFHLKDKCLSCHRKLVYEIPFSATAPAGGFSIKYLDKKFIR